MKHGNKIEVELSNIDNLMQLSKCLNDRLDEHFGEDLLSLNAVLHDSFLLELERTIEEKDLDFLETLLTRVSKGSPKNGGVRYE